MTPRPFDPSSYITAEAVARLHSVPINPWDTMTAATFLQALGIEDKMSANRWHYRNAPGTPPFEPVGIWRSGPGASRVIRKDRAVAWAESGGQSVSGRDCWPQAAEALAELGWPNLDGPNEVQGVLTLLIGKGVMRQPIRLRNPKHIGCLYA
jgi:hypothetical protein